MKITGILVLLGFFGGVSLGQTYSCLPTGVDESTVVSVGPSKNGKPGIKTTVGQSLQKLKARCVRGKLVDCKRKPVTIYRLEGCWGNPPADYLEILDRQRKELDRLKKTSTVIEIRCDTAGMPM